MIVALLLLVLITGFFVCAEVFYERDWPRSTIKGFAIALLLLLMGIDAFGQASRYDWTVSTINQSAPQPGGMYPVLNIPGSAVQICNSPANAVPCTNYAVTYEDAAQSATCSAPTQLTRPGTNVCVAGADAQGGFGLWIASGNYQYTVTTTYGSFGPYDFSVGGVGGAANPAGPSFAVNFANSSVSAFQGDPNIRIDPVNHQFNIISNGVTRTTVNTFTPEMFGSKHDAIILTDANCTGGSTTITTTTSTPFTSTAVDGGKTIVVVGCGALSVVQNSSGNGLIPTAFVSTIVSVTNSKTVVMAAAPPVQSGTVTTVTYISGITGTGTLAQTCKVTLPNGGTASLQMTGTNTFTSGVQLLINTLDTGEGSAPTTGTVSNGSATACAGTPVLTSTLAPAGWSNQWASFGTNDHDAINSCIQGGTNANGSCHLMDGAQYMVSTPTSGPNAGAGFLSIEATGGITHGLLDGKANLIFAPASPLTGGSNDRLLYVHSSLNACVSGAYSICPITTSPISKGATSFTAQFASDVSSLKAGQWLIIQELYAAGQNSYVDWMQVASVSGSTVTTVQPFRMAFPCTETIVPGVTGCGFRVVSNMTSDVTLRDFSITVPNIFDLAVGRAALGVTATAAVNLTLDKLKGSCAAQECYGDQFTRGTTLDGIYWLNELLADEFASDVDLTIKGGSTFSKKAVAINQYRSACAAGTSAEGINLDEGTGFYTINGIFIPESCTQGIASLQGVHDGSISDSNIGWLQCVGAPCFFNSNAVQFVGSYRNSVHDNTFAGSGSSDASAIYFANETVPAITAAGNSASNNKCNTATADFSNGCYLDSGTTDLIDSPGGATSQKLETYVPVLAQNTAPGSVYGLIGKPLSGTVQDSYGSKYSSAGSFLAFNASPNTVGGDSWQAYDAAVPSIEMQMETVFGFSLWSAAAGTCPLFGTNPFSTCFGTVPLLQISPTGTAIFSGQVRAGSINLSGTTNPLDFNSMSGVSGQCAISQGAGATPIWSTCPSGGVSSINTAAGAFTFTGPGVSCTSTTCTFSGTGTGIGSIAWSLPSFLTASPTTLSASGTQTFSLATQSANLVFAGPASGSAAAPTFRALVASDIPILNQSTTGNAATATTLAATPSQCSGSQFSTGIAASGNANCATPAGAVASVTNSDSSLTITPTTGAVVASLNTAHANSWSGAQTFTGSGIPIATGTTSNTDFAGFITLSGGTGTYNFTATHVTAPVCTANDTTAVAAVQVSATATVLTVTGTGTDVISYICIGRT